MVDSNTPPLFVYTSFRATPSSDCTPPTLSPPTPKAHDLCRPAKVVGDRFGSPHTVTGARPSRTLHLDSDILLADVDDDDDPCSPFVDSHHSVFVRNMNSPSPPIDIAPPVRVSSASPRSSNLTSALQQAGYHPSHSPMDIPTQNPHEHRGMPMRQDSLGYGLSGSHSGARPISFGKQRRESSNGGAGGYAGGMSWGGISLGSWLQDDVAMAGTSPYNVQSPSLHSSSYLPKMEANFWNNLRCCDTSFTDLHELLQHFEDVHKDAPSTFPYRMSVPGSGGIHPVRGSTPSNQMNFNNAHNVNSKMHMNGVSSQMQSGMPDGMHKSSLSNMQDMDTLGEMELDDDQPMPGAHGMPSFSQRPDGFPQNSTAPVNPSNVMPDKSTYSSMDSTPRMSKDFTQRNNPMVSSVNTPSIGLQTSSPTQQQQPHSPVNGIPSADDIANNPQLMASLQAEFGNMDFANGGGDMLDLCINDPAKSLFTDQGAINSQQYPQFSFLNGANTNSEEVARRLQHAQQLAAARGQLPSEEDRPFKCPVIGCEKAYKNANGLRYHEKHGHSTQKLQENGDGTYSIVDPVTSIPYPGTVGMEKEKPYRCEVCGKRYKNLNGLKYHRNHSPPCNPEFKFGEVGLPGMGNGNNIGNSNDMGVSTTGANMGGGGLGDGIL